MKTVYVGIDPGGRTGIVIYTTVSGKTIELKGKGTFRSYNLGYQFLLTTIADPGDFKGTERIDTILILERPAQRKPGSEKSYPIYLRYKETLERWATGVDTYIYQIGPGQWKPLAKSLKWKKPKGFTTHEGDALNLIRYYILSKQRRTPTQIDKLINDAAIELLEGLKNAKKRK